MIPMPDSIRPGDMPPGYPAYLAYVDGPRSKDADAVRARFPLAEILTLTVIGGQAQADGCDRENGDVTPQEAAAWLRKQVVEHDARPVLYDSRDNVPVVLGLLASLGVERAEIRILSAHWGSGEHICSPSACGASFTADGTQWTDAFPGLNGSVIDMSALADDFFGPVSVPVPPAQWTEFDMARVPILATGASDKPGGGFWYVHRLQALVKLTGQLQGITAASVLAVDGAYGPLTADAVRAVQAHYGIGQDGITGPQTWSVLLTGAAA